VEHEIALPQFDWDMPEDMLFGKSNIAIWMPMNISDGSLTPLCPTLFFRSPSGQQHHLMLYLIN